MSKEIKFYNCQINGSCLEENSLKRGLYLYTTLLDSILKPSKKLNILRRPSLCHDGTPLVYSMKIQSKEDFPAFRMIVEPGNLEMTVAQQIDWSLLTTERCLSQMGWNDATEDINYIVKKIFPKDKELVNQWWGGIWLGMQLDKENVDLRMYMNLRSGSAKERWSRVIDTLSIYTDPSSLYNLTKLSQRVFPIATPVGLAIVIRKKVLGFRLYVGVEKPSVSLISVAISNYCTHFEEELDEFCKNFEHKFDEFNKQTVTLGYDIPLDSNHKLSNKVTRTKIDFCLHIYKNCYEKKLSLIHNAITPIHNSRPSISSFLKNINNCYGGLSLEFLSLGFSSGLDHVTVYAKPNGISRK